jgi:hypothetical protein
MTVSPEAIARKARPAFLLCATAAVVLALSPSAALADVPACNLIGAHTIASIFDLPHHHLIRSGSSAAGSWGTEPGAFLSNDHSRCDLGLWRGATPESRADLFARVRAGDAAQIGFSTWIPDGPNASDWEAEGFAETVTRFRRTRFKAVRKLQGIVTTLKVPSEGHTAIGALFSAPAPRRGLEAAVGCWSDERTSKILCILDAESPGKRVVAHLSALASKAVPAFLG